MPAIQITSSTKIIDQDGRHYSGKMENMCSTKRKDHFDSGLYGDHLKREPQKGS
jgi:hypothetical protein